MQTPIQKDNSTFEKKAALRSRLLMKIEHPAVMETHGGFGKLYARCYAHVQRGVVFEADGAKSGYLAQQRPTWSVYEVKCGPALAEGVGRHLEINFLDMDPYGEPWDDMSAFFESKRPFAPRMGLVVNDGLRQKLKLGAGWHVHSMREIVKRVGNNKLYADYLQIAQELVQERAAIAGYQIKEWTGYHCGHGNDMTHYAAILERTA